MSLINRFNKQKSSFKSSIQHIVPFYVINSDYTVVSDAITFYQTDFKDSYNTRLWRSKWKLFFLNSSESIPKNAI
jgi:hypothetical protein